MTQVLRDFQNTRPSTKEYLLALVELLAIACHQIATLLFQLDQGVHKHELYAAWRDSPDDHLPSWHRLRPPCAFTHWSYIHHEQYPHGLADLASYWAEAKIFGGVIIFDRGPSGIDVSLCTSVAIRVLGDVANGHSVPLASVVNCICTMAALEAHRLYFPRLLSSLNH